MGRLQKVMAGAVVAALAALPTTSQADSIQHGTGDWARMAYNSDANGSLFLFITVTRWGTQYYDGVPPQNQGGLGESSVCLHYIYATESSNVHAFGCPDSMFTFETLQTVSIDQTIELQLWDGNGDPIGTEVATLNVSMVGSGPVLPGARAATNPGPGVEGQYELMRNAVASGSASTPTIGWVDLAGTPATLERKNCVGYAIADSDTIQACRFNG